VAHQTRLALAYPKRALPGQEITVGLELKDPSGAPLAGGPRSGWWTRRCSARPQARLDPVPSFLSSVVSFFRARDTRRHGLRLPASRHARAATARREANLLDRQTVRKNFQAGAVLRPGDRHRPRRQGERAGQAVWTT
jgi:hypothetical protein